MQYNINKSWQLSFFITVLVYFISHFLMFFVDGTGWDDMYVWYTTPDKVYNFLGPETFNNPIMLWINNTINAIGNFETQTIVHRLSAFTGNLFSVLSIWYIVKTLTKDYDITLLTSMLAAACSVNKCMILICCYHYTFSNAWFLLGLCFLVSDYYDSKWWKKVVCGILWFLSFTLWKSSALLMPVCLLVAASSELKFSWKQYSFYYNIIKNVVKLYWFIILLLLIAAVLYILYLSPQGVYKDYYKVGVSNILLSPVTCIFSCFSIFIEYIGNVLGAFANRKTEVYLLAVVLMIALSFIFRKTTEKKLAISKSMLYITLLFFYFSVYPQMLKGRLAFVCDIDNYGSKTASLASLPISIILVYCLSMLPSRFKHLLYCLLMSGSILYSASVYMDYNKFWCKKICTIDFLKEHPDFEGKSLLIIDTATEFDAFPRAASTFYDYEGCTRFAYGKNNKTKISTFYPYQERADDFDPDYTIFIYKNHDVSSFELLKSKMFNTEKYTEQVRNMLLFKTENKIKTGNND